MLKCVSNLLVIDAYHDYEKWKMDVKIYFLNENLLVEVYMIQLEGFDTPEEAKRICKL